jgi:hypothetical protein
LLGGAETVGFGVCGFSSIGTTGLAISFFSLPLLFLLSLISFLATSTIE